MGVGTVTQFHVVGLDPSMTGFGVAVIRPGAEFRPVLGLIKSDPVQVPDGMDQTIPQLYRLRGLVARARRIAMTGFQEGDVFIAVMEGPALGAPGSTKQQHQDTRAGLRWLTMHTFEVHGRPQPNGLPGAFVIVPPKTLKRYVARNGNADKDLMKQKARDVAFPGIDFTNGARSGKLDDNLVDAYGLAAMACRVLGLPVEPSPQRVDPGALRGAYWPRFMEQNRSDT